MRNPNRAKTDPLNPTGTMRDEAIDFALERAVEAWINDDMSTAEELVQAAESYCYTSPDSLFES